MHYIRTEWKDGKADLVAVLNPNPPGMYFNYEGTTVAYISDTGNLNIKGELHEDCNPEDLVCVHSRNDQNGLWPAPVCLYKNERVWALLGPDPSSSYGVEWPLCFWNETDFFVWGKLQTNVPGPPSLMVFFNPVLMENGSTYNQMGIRGILVSEQTPRIADDSQTPTE